jgi:hypothetical protein
MKFLQKLDLSQESCMNICWIASKPKKHGERLKLMLLLYFSSLEKKLISFMVFEKLFFHPKSF